MLSIGWGLAAMLSAVSGMMAARRLVLDPNFMLIVLTYAFAAAVLGGIDSPVGAVVGAFLIGIGISLLERLRVVVPRHRAPAAARARRADARADRPPRRPLRPRRREARLRCAGSLDRASLLRVGVLVAVPLLVVLLPQAFDDYFNYRLAFVGIYFIAIVGLNVLTGYSGQISLGHGAFLAIGAYTTAILVVEVRRRRVLDDPDRRRSSPAPSASSSGFPALRLSGVYLALATFSLASSLPLIAKRFEGFTGGGRGLTMTLPSSPIGGLTTNEWLSYLTWAIAAVMFGAAWLLAPRPARALAPRGPRRADRRGLLGDRAGRAQDARLRDRRRLRGRRRRAATRSRSRYVNPDTFPVSLSILLLTGAVVGGLGSLEGMLFGAVFIQFAPTWAEQLSKQLHYNEGTIQPTRVLRADPARRPVRDARRRGRPAAPRAAGLRRARSTYADRSQAEPTA